MNYSAHPAKRKATKRGHTALVAGSADLRLTSQPAISALSPPVQRGIRTDGCARSLNSNREQQITKTSASGGRCSHAQMETSPRARPRGSRQSGAKKEMMISPSTLDNECAGRRCSYRYMRQSIVLSSLASKMSIPVYPIITSSDHFCSLGHEDLAKAPKHAMRLYSFQPQSSPNDSCAFWTPSNSCSHSNK
jgi:hypothetical protein